MGKKRNTYRIPVGKPQKGRVHLEKLGVNGRILQWSLKKCDRKGVGSVQLCQGRDKRWTSVDMVKKLRVP